MTASLRTKPAALVLIIAGASLAAVSIWSAPNPQEPQLQREPVIDLSVPAAMDDATVYTCPMHPQIRSGESDASCPICGMDLVPLRASEDGSADHQARSGPDRAITVSPGMLQTIGVRTAAATVAPFGRTVRAFGTVERNERLASVSVSRVEGWTRELQIGAVGDRVRAGDLLYRIYSPALLSAQREYLQTLSGGDSRRQAAVLQRLRSLGMQERAIQDLASTSSLVEEVPVYAESSGTVVALAVREGAYLKPGDPVLTLQSYEEVWVIAQLAEQDLPFVETGQTVQLAFPSAPAATSRGRIEYIYPTIDPATRTGQVRIVMPNPELDLRPGAYADVTVELEGAARLYVPSEAVLRDSRGAHVVLALGAGRFVGRPVRTGLVAGGRTEILEGLQSGDEVVTSAQFLLDSEVNLREGLDKLSSPADSPQNDSLTDPHQGHRH